MTRREKEMTRGSLLVALAMAALLLPAPAYASESVYVQLAGTRLLAEPSRSSPAVTTLAVGEELDLLQSVGKFYQVRTAKKKTGYVQRFRVSRTPPGPTSNDKNDLDTLIGSLENAPRTAAMTPPRSGHSIRGRTRAPQKDDSASHSIRGLDRDEGASHGASAPVADASLEKLEAQSVQPAALDAFQRTGKVGPYAE